MPWGLTFPVVLGTVALVPVASRRMVDIWANGSVTAAQGFVTWAGVASPLRPQGLAVWPALVSKEEPRVSVCEG